MMLIFHCFLQKAMKIFRKLWELGSDDLKFCIPNLSYHKKGALKKSATIALKTIAVKCALKFLKPSSIIAPMQVMKNQPPSPIALSVRWAQYYHTACSPRCS